ncbi:GntR family transcriptional regulator [Allopusillimonas soli]|uniref:GntR family transcriptional regulator n=1 Tax=Allopusillimonas soli TaxID=659016 RepID=A0A853FBJ5_9BURK|nr:GntR family transcriptional regulator [Allopusillimonas soli]NYT38135.1 GntR family transcriptional regulator [Allopusillimonas soli]TEA74012.1 GntR family transcriptional regulator [Allopusillimonas soli]
MTQNLNAALRRQSRLPLSLKIKYVLRSRLERGEWPVGARIPTLPELMREYGVSRATLRAALDELEAEGLIERTRGKGTYVIGDAAKEHWLMLPTDWKSLVKHIEHLRVRFDVLETGLGSLPPELADAHVASSYWWSMRVNWTDSLPYSLNTVYVASRLAERQLERFETEPVLPVLARHFRSELRTATQVLTIRGADATAARHLDVEIGVPVAQALRVAKNARGETVYAARVLYPAKYLYIETHFHPFDE